MEKILVSDVRILENIYLIQNKVAVYKVEHIRTGRIFCMKKIYIDNQNQLRDITYEFVNLASLKHPNLISLRSVDTVCDNSSRVEYVSIFTDYYHEGDLSKLISKRRLSLSHFTDNEIFDMASQIVESLAYLQEKGVAHRDIKPENIFINAGKYIIGDFGSLLVKDNFNGCTLVGTPLYLSPILRNNYDRSDFLVAHNVFKSDVYSLGLTILYMATFCDMNQIFSSQNREELINQNINRIKSNSIKALLKKMLNYDEDSRFDFIQTKKFLETSFSSVCLICDQKNIITKFFVSGGVCESCSQRIETIFKEQKKRGKVRKIHDSEVCLGVFNQPICCCGIKICMICKNPEHPGATCLSLIKSLPSPQRYTCPCTCTSTLAHNSYFLSCPDSHIICVVCSELYFNSNHEICVFLFTNIEIPNLT